MSDMTRREVLELLAGVPGAMGLTPPLIERAWEHVRTHPKPAGRDLFQPVFFTPHEYQTVQVLCDYLIPREERSGSATDAGVPEFMDFILHEQTDLQPGFRNGLAWLDSECRRRFGADFAAAGDQPRRGVLDDIAWPARARPEFSAGAAFFTRFRDLAASGFYSSKLGMEDLRYLGNTPVERWSGCPPEALRKLGLHPQ
jgi:hypothetical protein